MNKFQEFIENIPDKEKELPKVTRNNTTYYSSRPLTKRHKLNVFNNKKSMFVLAIALIICILITLTQCGRTFDVTIGSQAAVNNNLSKAVEYNIPIVAKYKDMSNAEIDNELTNMIQIVNEHDAQDPNYYDKYKAPDPNEYDKANKIVSKGLSNLNSDEASYIYNGGWQLTVDRTSTPSSRVKYVDFKSNTEDAAIKAAIDTQNFVDTYIDSSGKDELGNTYTSGSAKYNGKTIMFRISAIKFNEAYNIQLPDNAIIIGIKIS